MELNEETTVTTQEAEQRLDAAARTHDLGAFLGAAADLIDAVTED